MNQEIKFRGICSDGKWKYGYYAYCQNTKHHLILDHTPVFSEDKSDVKFGLVPWQVKEDTIGQFTGLKDKNGKEDSIYRPRRKNPLNLARHSPVLLFLMQARDEAHRFGISFHRRMRRKKTLASELDAVPGIGPARRKMLLKTLGSIARIKKTRRKELATVPGIGDELAAEIYRFFHGGPKG